MGYDKNNEVDVRKLFVVAGIVCAFEILVDALCMKVKMQFFGVPFMRISEEQRMFSVRRWLLLPARNWDYYCAYWCPLAPPLVATAAVCFCTVAFCLLCLHACVHDVGLNRNTILERLLRTQLHRLGGLSSTQCSGSSLRQQRSNLSANIRTSKIR